MATTLTHQQRLAREKQVRQLIDSGLGLSGLARTLGVSKQAVWQFCSIRGWLDDMKGNDAKARERAALDRARRKAAERDRAKAKRAKQKKSIKSGLDSPASLT